MSRVHIAKSSNNLKSINLKNNYFKNSSFPSVLDEWKKLEKALKKQILDFIGERGNSIFRSHNPVLCRKRKS